MRKELHLPSGLTGFVHCLRDQQPAGFSGAYRRACMLHAGGFDLELWATSCTIQQRTRDRRNAFKGSEGSHADSVDDLIGIGISSGSNTEPSALAHAAGQRAGDAGRVYPPPLRGRRIVPPTLPSSQNSSGPEASPPGLFFVQPTGGTSELIFPVVVHHAPDAVPEKNHVKVNQQSHGNFQEPRWESSWASSTGCRPSLHFSSTTTRLLAALLRELRVYFADFAVKSFCSVSLL